MGERKRKTEKRERERERERRGRKGGTSMVVLPLELLSKEI